MSKISLNVHLYCRLVDDISVIVQGDFAEVVSLVELMAAKYPQMPLNVQISFGYSRFLDLHIYNICSKSERDYKLVHSLAYKEHSSFAYTSMHSNINEKYKHAIVPIYLYRIHTRCTEKADKDSHLYFMSNMLKNRAQDPVVVKTKTRKYFLKKKQLRNVQVQAEFQNLRKTTSITFDNSNKRHLFLKRTIRNSTQSRLMVVYKSRPKIGSLLCPKRRTIRKLKHYLSQIE